MDTQPIPDEFENQDVDNQVGMVDIASAAVMNNVRDVAGRVGGHQREAPTSYRSTGWIPGQVETIDLTSPTRLDQQLGFPCHSIVVDNPTTQWLFVQSAQRFAPPGVMGYVMQVPKASTQAQAVWRAPGVIAQPTLGFATMATLTFCEAFLMPNPGILIPVIGPAALGATPIQNSSGAGTTGAISAQLPAIAGRTAYVTGFELTSGGATGALVGVVNLTGILGGTLTYVFAVPAGVTLGAAPLIVEFPIPIPASGLGVQIQVAWGGSGAGCTAEAITIHGFYI